MKQQIIAQAAEAIIYKQGNNIIKDRISKSYRIKELDNKIRKLRTRSEAKLLEKAGKIINCPIPLFIKNKKSVDDNQLKKEVINNKFPSSGGGVGKPKDYKIIMPFIDGKKLSEHLEDFSLAKQKQILNQIGQDVAKLHNADIIHGDLTTSNMILVENLSASQKNKENVNKKRLSVNSINKSCLSINNNSRGVAVGVKIYFIDFGLGYISKKPEDKAVDIHLLKQALEAKHFKNWEVLFKEFEKGYSKNYSESKIILERLKAVERRGRYKH